MYSSLLPQPTTFAIGFSLNAANDVAKFFLHSRTREKNNFLLDTRTPKEQGIFMYAEASLSTKI